jgi:hypothetical protein
MSDRAPSRRDFISCAAAVAAAGFLPATRPDRASADATPPIILGEGQYRYECQHDWGRLPETIQYGLTHGVAVDRAGNVYVLHTSRSTSPVKDTVVVFDREGNFVRSWGAEYYKTAHGFDLVEEDGREVF